MVKPFLASMDVFRLPADQVGGHAALPELSSLEQLRVLLAGLDLSQEAFALTDLATGRCLDCNPVAHQRLGFSREAYLELGLAGLQADPEHDDAWLTRQLQGCSAGQAGSFLTRHRCSDGTAIDVLVRFQLMQISGRELLLTMHRDSTALVEATARSERLNQLLLDAEALSQIGSWELVHATGELLWSQGAHRIFETTAAAFSPTYEAFLAVVHPEDRQLVREAFEESVLRGEPYQVNHRLLCSDGRIKVVQERGSTRYDEHGKPLRSIGTVQDITRLAEAEAELERAAYTDPLTKLPNRQAAVRHLAALCAETAQLAPAGLAVLNLDVDQFQAINDSFGTVAGDRLLLSIATTLRRDLPASAFLARLESDEFLVLVPGSAVAAEQLARRIQHDLIHSSQRDPTMPLLPSVSIGVSHCTNAGGDSLALLQAANTALMEAKRKGKGGFCLYSDAISERIRQRVSLEAELQEAIAREAFHLVFQPQVNRRGAMVGAEVLLRWHDQRGVPVSPAEFIPLAEQSGLIHTISAWVVEQTSRQVRAWLDRGLAVPPLAINLSAVQFGLPEGQLVGSLLEIIGRYGLEPRAFELEVTETALLDHLELCREASLALSAAGFSLAIDDFGTGYASMVNLRSLPVHTIKIDSSFVQRMNGDSVDRAIVNGMVRLAHDLNMVALAEGVETDQQWQQLLDFGCDCFQGYLFDRPLSAEAFAARLAAAM